LSYWFNGRLEIISGYIDIYAKHFLGYNSLLDIDNSEITVNITHNTHVSNLKYRLRHVTITTENGFKLYIKDFEKREGIYVKKLLPKNNWE